MVVRLGVAVASSIWRIEARDAVKDPPVPRAAPTTKNYLAPKVSPARLRALAPGSSNSGGCFSAFLTRGSQARGRESPSFLSREEEMEMNLLLLPLGFPTGAPEVWEEYFPLRQVLSFICNCLHLFTYK